LQATSQALQPMHNVESVRNAVVGILPQIKLLTARARRDFQIAV